MKHLTCLLSAFALIGMGLASTANAQRCLLPNFEVKLLSQVPEIEHPSVVTCDEKGNLFVGLDPMDMRGPATKEFDQIVRFEMDADGNPVRKTVFCEDLAAVFGMIWHDGALYVLHAPHYTMFRDTNGDGVADERIELADGFGPPAGVYGFNDHIVTGTHLGMDGRVYISIGDKGVPKAVGADGSTVTLEGGGIVRMKLDGTELEIVSSGTRNHLDVAMDSLDNMFTYDNTDDGVGWWTRFTHHVPTGYFGYPYDYHPHPERHLPRISEHGGGSPVGADAYREAAWPADLVDVPFMCEWGKQKVQLFRLTRDGATFTAQMEDFLVPDETGEPFRPQDLCFSPNGKHMYVADWNYNGWVNAAVKGRLYRVTYTGDKPAVSKEPAHAPLQGATTAQWIGSLAHPSHAERMRAEFAIARSADAVRRANKLITDASAAPLAKIHAIWAGSVHSESDAIPAADKVDSTPVWISALNDANGDVRAQAARALGLHRTQQATQALAQHLQNDGDATVRLQCAVALGRIGDVLAEKKWRNVDSIESGVIRAREDDKNYIWPTQGNRDLAKLLWPALADEDPTVRHVTMQALRLVNNWQDAPEYLKDDKTAATALVTLTGVYDLDAIETLRQFALTGSNSAEQAKAVAALKEVYKQSQPYEKGWWGTQPARGKPARSKNIAWSGTEPVAATFRDVLNASQVSEVRLAAIEALQDVQDEQCIELLRQIAASGKSADESTAAIMALAQLKDRASAELFASIAGNDKLADATRREAIRGLAILGSDTAIDQLLAITASSGGTPELKIVALETLSTLKNAKSVDPVRKLLADGTPAIRASAIKALGHIQGADAVAAILPTLKDENADVRKAALKTLSSLQSAEAVPAMLTAADDPEVQFEAQMALAAVPDRRALPHYIRGVTSANQELRTATMNALLAIRDSIRDDIVALNTTGELANNARRPLQGVFEKPAPILKWDLIGSFPKEGDNSEPPGFNFAGAPDLGESFHVGTRSVAWQKIETQDKDGRVSPANYLKGPREGVWCYAYAPVERDEAGLATLQIGSDDQLMIWVNGKQVYDFNRNSGWSKDRDTISVEFNAGVNHLWLRCGNDGGPWDFSVAIGQRDKKLAFLYQDVPEKLDIASFRDFAGKNSGDVTRGKKFFENTQGAACVKCHAVNGVGGKVGPDLVGIGSKYPREELIRSILEPSLRIANGYDTGVVMTVDGTVVTGVLKLESPEAVELMTADGKTIRIADDDIEDFKRSPLSSMPNGIQEGMQLQDFADIVSYLESLKIADKP
ncbi:HEAT repeat domain-containing protein [Blastopirellula sp. JC732]|uniref:HEAT repeat domain-containing protein n=1 Tax=Blastopirellula sediminis TaxID=2894196 RepID=A0A9X1SDZ8_9BACT|nr:PVC-type heme-binding CxxCH protein [Blastopirellula sediminis]MCC9607972.1 HEAT repeat domain-containing protein [Blastopirellula sediminis]MCC9627235.1 HEAT repeat domain-containing protein [Blastopirellula sediminis]